MLLEIPTSVYGTVSSSHPSHKIIMIDYYAQISLHDDVPGNFTSEIRIMKSPFPFSQSIEY